ncbi:MAG TPA: choice-of-anchor Q domain-containing protein, partial [Candidatus Saccharimonadales bacterium]|nr:choice-of-anchor Q domain-containing protein [Candidatus Saccharimonadales bacterium]
SQAATNPATTSTANVFVSPNGSDSGANCLRFTTAQTNPDPTGASLCASFNKAYQLAGCGDTIEAEAGNYYEHQTSTSINYDSTKVNCSSNIVIQPTVGATAAIQSDLRVYAQYLTFKNMTFRQGNPMVYQTAFSGANNNLIWRFRHHVRAPSCGVTVNCSPEGLPAIEYDDPGAANQQLAITIQDGNKLHVSLATDASGNITTTANDIISAVVADTDPGFTANQVSVTTAGNADGTGAVAAFPQTTLTGTLGVWFDVPGGTDCADVASNDVIDGSNGDTFNIIGAKDITIENSTWGNYEIGQDSQVGYRTNCDPASDISIIGNTIENAYNDFASDPADADPNHPDGIQVDSGFNGLVISGNHFKNLLEQQIFIRLSQGTANALNLKVENNFIGPRLASTQTWTMQLTNIGSTNTCSGAVIAFNTFVGDSEQATSPVLSCPVSPGGVPTQVIGNIMSVSPSAYSCTSNQNTYQVVYDYNVYGSGVPCGTHDVVASQTYVNSANSDLHLTVGDSAIDYVPTSISIGCPITDIDGNTRPQGAACDAGADEYITPPAVWVSTTGDDSTCIRGDSTKPCASLNQAYLVAQPGDTIQVACGDYPAQTINYDSTKAGSTDYITFEPASTSGICWNQTDKIVIGNSEGASAPSYIKLGHFSMTGGIDNFYKGSSGDIVDNTVYAFYPATHIIIDHQSGGSFGFSAVTDFLVENSDLGNCESEAYPNAQGVMTTDFCVSELRAVPSQTGLSDVANPPKNSGSIINTKFHDISGDTSNLNCGSSGCHVTGFAVFGGDGVTYDHDAWWNDEVTGMRFQNFCGCTSQELKNFTIQNSWYDLSGSAFEVNSEVDGLVVRFNSMTVHSYIPGDGITRHAGYISCDAGSMDTNGSPAGVNACGTDTNHAKFYGNILTNAGCFANTDWSYNIFVPFSISTGLTACGTNATTVSSVPYTADPAAGVPNFNITDPSWTGNNYIPLSIAGGYPTTDYYGNSRPGDTGLLDAGSVEQTTLATSTTPGDLNSDGHVNITDLSIMLSNWGTTNSTCDLNTNGSVDIFDLSILLSHYGV